MPQPISYPVPRGEGSLDPSLNLSVDIRTPGQALQPANARVRTGAENLANLIPQLTQTIGAYKQAFDQNKRESEHQAFEDAKQASQQLLLNPQSDNPEWLTNQALVKYQNSATQGERDIWFSVLHEAKNESQVIQREQQHDTKLLHQQNLAAANLTAQQMVDVFVEQIAADPSLQDNLTQDGTGIHKRVFDFSYDQARKADPRRFSIAENDPDRVIKTDANNDLLRELYSQTQPIAKFLQDKYLKNRDDFNVLHGANNAQGLFNLYAAGKISLPDVKLHIQAMGAGEFASLSPATQEDLLGKGIKATVGDLAALPEGVAMQTAIAKIEELKNDSDFSVHKNDLSEVAARIFPNAVARRTTAVIANMENYFGRGLMIGGVALQPDVQKVRELMLNRGYSAVRSMLYQEAGILNIENLNETQGVIKATIDSEIKQSMGAMKQRSEHEERVMEAHTNLQSNRPFDGNLAWEGSIFTKMIATGDVDPLGRDFQRLSALYRAQYGQQIPYDPNKGPITPTAENAQVFQTAGLLMAEDVNANAYTKPSTDMLDMVRDGVRSNNVAIFGGAVTFYSSLSPELRGEFDARLSGDEKDTLQDAMFRNVKSLYGQALADTMNSVQAITPEQRQAARQEASKQIQMENDPLNRAKSEQYTLSNSVAKWFKQNNVQIPTSGRKAYDAIEQMVGNDPVFFETIANEIYTLKNTDPIMGGNIDRATSRVMANLYERGYRVIDISPNGDEQQLRFWPDPRRHWGVGDPKMTNIQDSMRQYVSQGFATPEDTQAFAKDIGLKDVKEGATLADMVIARIHQTDPSAYIPPKETWQYVPMYNPSNPVSVYWMERAAKNTLFPNGEVAEYGGGGIPMSIIIPGQTPNSPAFIFKPITNSGVPVIRYSAFNVTAAAKKSPTWAATVHLLD